MRRSAASLRPRSSSSSRARVRASAPVIPYRPHCSSRSSRPVCTGSSPISWSATPIRRRTSAGSPATSIPATLALPAVRGSRVQSIRTVVVFPAPFGPRKPNTSPAATSRSISRTASMPPLNVRFRARVSTAWIPVTRGFDAARAGRERPSARTARRRRRTWPARRRDCPASGGGSRRGASVRVLRNGLPGPEGVLSSLPQVSQEAGIPSRHDLSKPQAPIAKSGVGSGRPPDVSRRPSRQAAP